jgi:hypothetical protein
MIFLCVHADKYGLVDMTPDSCRKILEWSDNEFKVAMHVLSSPDPDSASRKEEGRRILPSGGFASRGIQIVNYAAYRAMQTEEDRKEYMRSYYEEKIKPRRKSVVDNKSTDVNTHQQVSTHSRQAEAEADTEAKAEEEADRNVSESAAVVPGRSLNETIEGVKRKMAPSPLDSPPADSVFAILTNQKGVLYHVLQDDVLAFQGLYPAVDVMQELRNIVAWVMTNQEKRKTLKGCPAFVNRWLAKEQNRFHSNGNSRTKPGYVSAADMDAFAKSVSEGK